MTRYAGWMISLAGVAVSVPILASSPSYAADNLIVKAALELCVSNRAAPKDVLAQADASGWGSDAGGLLDMLNMVPTYRSRTIGSVRLKVLTGQTMDQVEGGFVRVSTCTITSTEPDRAGTLAALRERLGPDQYAEAENLHIWAFFDDGHSARPMQTFDEDTNDKLLKSGTINSYVLGENGQDQLLMYSEWRKVGPSE